MTMGSSDKTRASAGPAGTGAAEAVLFAVQGERAVPGQASFEKRVLLLA